MQEVKSNCASGMKQAMINVIAIGTGIMTSREKPKAFHNCLRYTLKILYIIQTAAIEMSEIQAPSVKTINSSKRNARTARNGIGIKLTINNVFRIFFDFAVNNGIVTDHTAIIDTIAIIDHDSLSAVK